MVSPKFRALTAHYHFNTGMYLLIAFGIIFLIASLDACSSSRLDISKVKREEFKIIPLDFPDTPYYSPVLAPLKHKGPVDKQGIPLYVYKDKKLYYQPVFLCLRIFKMISSYTRSKNEAYLKRAELYAGKLVEVADEYDGALFFPYEFDNKLKAKKPGKYTFVKAPWYSGMAQGQALSVFSQLYDITKKKEYLEIAKKIFASFLIVERKKGPWVVRIDELSYLWIEECHVPQKTTILNGFIFAIYGLYDYYKITNDQLCKKIFQAAVTTIKTYINLYRNKGNISFYCLGRYLQTTLLYHHVHIGQLRMLYKMTGDIFFERMADRFYKDAHNETEPTTKNPKQ